MWVSGQDGTAILFKSVNQDGKCTWCVTEYVTFRNNIVRGAANGLVVNAAETGQRGLPLPVRANHVRLENVLFEDIGGSQWGGGGKLLRIFGGVSDVSVTHVTSRANGTGVLDPGDPSDSNPRLVFCYNIVERLNYGIGAGSDEGAKTLSRNFAPYTYKQNVLVNTSAGGRPGDFRRRAPGTVSADDVGRARMGRRRVSGRQLEAGEDRAASSRGRRRQRHRRRRRCDCGGASRLVAWRRRLRPTGNPEASRRTLTCKFSGSIAGMPRRRWRCSARLRVSLFGVCSPRLHAALIEDALRNAIDCRVAVEGADVQGVVLRGAPIVLALGAPETLGFSPRSASRRAWRAANPSALTACRSSLSICRPPACRRDRGRSRATRGGSFSSARRNPRAGRGVAAQLYRSLMADRSLVAHVALDNAPSIRLHRSLGWRSLSRRRCRAGRASTRAMCRTSFERPASSGPVAHGK